MSEQEERLKNINAAAVNYVEDWLMKLDEGEMEPDHLLALTYGGLIVAALLGYSPQALVDDAVKAANRLLSDIPEEDLTSE